MIHFNIISRLHLDPPNTLFPSNVSTEIVYTFYLDYRIKEDEMGEACRSHDCSKKCVEILVGKTEKRPLVNASLHMRIILK
jgi:hypothetical protein